MRISFKTELKLNNYQRTQLAKHAGVARHAWNWGLALCKKILNYNQEHPDEKLIFPSAIDLHKLLVKWVKAEKTWYYEVSKTSPQYALKHLSIAFCDFFKKKTILVAGIFKICHLKNEFLTVHHVAIVSIAISTPHET